MRSSHRMTNEEQITTLQRVTALRQRTEVGVAGSSAVALTEATFVTFGGVHAARYGGVERASQRQFHCLLLCSPSGVSVFYYEVIGATEQETEARVRPIFNSVALGAGQGGEAGAFC